MSITELLPLASILLVIYAAVYKSSWDGWASSDAEKSEKTVDGLCLLGFAALISAEHLSFVSLDSIVAILRMVAVLILVLLSCYLMFCAVYAKSQEDNGNQELGWGAQWIALFIASVFILIIWFI